MKFSLGRNDVLVLRLVAAVVLLQTLFFKFTGAPESIFIFQTLGVEPFGRYFAGFSELIVSVLLFVPGFAWAGALMGIGVMSGAVLSHLLILGIEIQGDGGLLFALALVVLFSCVVIAYNTRNQAVAFLKSKGLIKA